MAVVHATRNHSSAVAHALVTLTIALGLVIGAFAVGALASYGGIYFVSR
jgi:hypothetical protein